MRLATWRLPVWSVRERSVMAPLLTRGPEINLKRRTFLARTDNLGADPTVATTRSGLGGAARSAFFSSTSSSEISVAITDNDGVEIAMSAQDSNTTPNIGAQAPGQGADVWGRVAV
ncbi:hypothetical protein OSI46_24895, partial [Mycobacterium ulcerans]